MDKLIKTGTGGFPLKLDDFLWENGELDASNYGMYEAIQAQLLAYGTDYIVEGCTYAAPNITAGWIMLDSELIRVDAHAGTDDYFEKVSTFDSRGDKVFKDASSQSTYQKNRAILQAASGSLNVTTAKRLEDKVIELLATSTEQFDPANIPNISAVKLTSGLVDPARLYVASTTTKGVAELATQTEVDNGTDDITIITPYKLRSTTFVAAQIPNLDASKTTTGTFGAGRLPAATTSLRGAAELATQAEVDGGIETTKIIAPDTLRNTVFEAGQLPQATIGIKGAALLAQTSEAQALTNDTKIITPAKLGDVLESAWSTLTLATGFTAKGSNPIKYRKIGTSLIHIIGYVDKDTTLATLIGTLPAGYRPSTLTYFVVSSSFDNVSSGSADHCYITTGGAINYAVNTSTAYELNINALVPIDAY